MAERINTKATIAKRAVTSFILYGVLNKGFCSGMVLNSLEELNHLI